MKTIHLLLIGCIVLSLASCASLSKIGKIEVEDAISKPKEEVISKPKFDITNWHGVVWGHTFGGLTRTDEPFSLQQTSDGGYIIAGLTRSGNRNNDVDALLIKTDAQGQKLWDRTFGGSQPDVFRSVQQTSDGGYILAGINLTFQKTSSCAMGNYNGWLIKTDKDGHKLWDQTFDKYDKDDIRSVQQTSDGGYILVGYTWSYKFDESYLEMSEEERNRIYSKIHSDVWLIKTDSEGHKEWDRTFGGPYNDAAFSIQQTSDGGYIIMGLTKSYGAGDTDVWLIKTDAQGQKLWDRTFGGPYGDWGYSICLASDGGYVLAAMTPSLSESENENNIDGWLIKTDKNGHKVWDRIFDRHKLEEIKSVQQTSDGGYILVGRTCLSDDAWDKKTNSWDRMFSEAGSDVWLIKTDSEGQKEWDSTFGESDLEDRAMSILQTSDGGYVIAGFTDSVGIWLIKMLPLTSSAMADHSDILPFDPGIIISDNEVRFVDIPIETIQKFLEDKGSILGNIDLATYQLDPKIAERGGKSWSEYIGGRWNLDELKNDKPTKEKYSSAKIIYLSAKENNINPIILLAYLQKEQSLIEKRSFSGLQHVLNRAVGYGMKDEGDDLEKYGFLAQLTGLSYEIDLELPNFNKSYTKTIDGSKITIKSAFAHFHYNYTPYLNSAETLFKVYNGYRNYFLNKGYSVCN